MEKSQYPRYKEIASWQSILKAYGHRDQYEYTCCIFNLAFQSWAELFRPHYFLFDTGVWNPGLGVFRGSKGPM